MLCVMVMGYITMNYVFNNKTNPVHFFRNTFGRGVHSFYDATMEHN